MKRSLFNCGEAVLLQAIDHSERSVSEHQPKFRSSLPGTSPDGGPGISVMRWFFTAPEVRDCLEAPEWT